MPWGVPTYIPKVGPANEIRVVDLTLRIDMLSRSNNHSLGRSDIDERRLARIGMRNPY
jgi:hypothetical protein